MPTNAPPSRDPEELMRRRNLIRAAVLTTGAGIIPTRLAPTALAAPDHTTTTPNAALGDLTADMWHNNATYVHPHTTPAHEALIHNATWHWTQASILSTRVHASLRQRSLTTFATAARNLAAMHADRHRYHAATRLYDQAQRLALAAENHELAAWITASRAYMPLYTGDIPQTLLRCTQALRHLDKATRPGGRAAACAHTLRARAHAQAGNQAAAEEALRHAYGAMARYTGAGSPNLPAAHHPERFTWVKLHLGTAEVYAALGDETQRSRAAARATADPSLSAMHRPMLQLGEAETHHDPAHAAHTTLTMLRPMAPHIPGPILSRATRLHTRLTKTAPHTTEVNKLTNLLGQHTR